MSIVFFPSNCLLPFLLPESSPDHLAGGTHGDPDRVEPWLLLSLVPPDHPDRQMPNRAGLLNLPSKPLK
jgi:hypothetical protein